MRNEFAVAKVKRKRKCPPFHGGFRRREDIDIARVVFAAGTGVVFCVGTIIGVSGFLFLAGGIISAGGITDFAKGWFAAFSGG